jgi:hypothetical protein
MQKGEVVKNKLKKERKKVLQTLVSPPNPATQNGNEIT